MKSPKTKHEEIMFCIESTNDIVSEIQKIVEEIKAIVEHVDVARAAREQGLTVG